MSAPVRLLFLTSLPVISDPAVAVAPVVTIAVAQTIAIERCIGEPPLADLRMRAAAREALERPMEITP